MGLSLLKGAGRVVAVLCLVAASLGLVLMGLGAVRAEQQGTSSAQSGTTRLLARVETGAVVDRVTAEPKVLEATEPVGSPVKDGGTVTAAGVRSGGSVEFGGVLGEVNGRPVIVLRGDAPAYRNLGPGDRGKDVVSLQRSLAELGYTWGAVLGIYDEHTARGVAALWKDRGFWPVRGDGTMIVDERTEEATVPQGEAFFARSTPLRAVTSCGELRAQVQGPLCTVAEGGQRLVASLTLQDAERVSGTEPIVLNAAGGTTLRGKLSGKVASVSSRAPGATGSSDGDSAAEGQSKTETAESKPSTPTAVLFAVELEGSQVIPEIRGGEKAEIILRETPSDSLVVPSTAVHSDGSRTWVRRAGSGTDAQGALKDIDVTVNLCVRGRCAVTSLRSGDLAAGQNVLVGETPG